MARNFAQFGFRLFFFACIIVCTHCAKSKSEKKTVKDDGNGRVNTISKLLESQKVLKLNDKNFSSFIVERPRLYNAVVMFTATSPQYQCSICVRTVDTFEQAAKYYKNQYDFNTSSPDQRVAFFVLEVDDSRRTFEEMKLETVPRVYALPPREVGSSKLKMADYEIDNRGIIEGVELLLEGILKLVGVKVRSHI